MSGLTAEERFRQAKRCERKYESKASKRRAEERATEVILEWGRGTRPLSDTTKASVLKALREQPEKRAEIMAMLLSTIKPGMTYYGDSPL